MKIFNARFITVLSFAVFFALRVLADPGVFSAKVTPDEGLTGGPITAKVTAEIGGAGGTLYPSSVNLWQTTDSGQPIAFIGQMYDDGTHGDQTAADTIFTREIEISGANAGVAYFRVTAAYQGIRNRYQSPVVTFTVVQRIPDEVIVEAVEFANSLKNEFLQDLANGMNIEAARLKILNEAKANRNVTYAQIEGNSLSIVYGGVGTGVDVSDPNKIIDSGGGLTCLPAGIKGAGNTNLLIFAPGYTEGQNRIADHALSRFSQAAWMTFGPRPLSITKDGNASLQVMETWGDYGTVVIHTHGTVWSNRVSLKTGSLADAANRTKYLLDISDHSVWIGDDNRFRALPEFITKHCSSMPNTFYYLGSCFSLSNDTLWNALKAKGSKVAFGWSDEVDRAFNVAKFQELIDPMLPTNLHTVPLVLPLTAGQSYAAIVNKVDPDPPRAKLLKQVASPEWDNFTFAQSGIVNGNFEFGDFTGWQVGFDPGNNYQIVSGAKKLEGNFSAALGRWDTAFNGTNPTAEPSGKEWIFQDVVVPSDATWLRFDWWMETYDVAKYDWFDARLTDTANNLYQTLVEHGGKPGNQFGTYWTSEMGTPVWACVPVGGGWYETSAYVATLRGQKVRIYFSLRLDGGGDQTRVYIDNVRFE